MGAAPAAPQIAGMSAPAPMGVPQAPVGTPMPGFGVQGVDALTEKLQALEMGQATSQGGAVVGLDSNQFPRPIGPPPPPPTPPPNCPPHFMRWAVNALPNSQALRHRWALPIGIVTQPLAPSAKGSQVPVVNFGQSGIVRCRRCRTYINPFVQFIEGGRRWRCNVCATANEVPVEYFCSLDANGRRRDHDERPELSSGIVEFVAPAEYMVRPPMPPVFFFMIDVSYAAQASGMLQVAIQTIKDSLDELPGDERTQVGFLTFDSTLHLYNLKSSLSQPQMMVVSDLDDVFLPLPDDMLVNLSESRGVVDALLETLPSLVSQTTSVESAFGPALQAAYMIMQHIGGKLLCFQTSMPSLGSGRLKIRDDPKVYGTEREFLLRNPDDAFYKKMSAECSRVQICVDMFAFPQQQYMDMASLSTLSKYTGGQVYHYQHFHSQRDGQKFANELKHNLTREVGWEAVMRMRCSKGLVISAFHGHFFVRSTDLLGLPAVDCDQAFAVEVSLEENVLAGNVAYAQCALLYTNSRGERRIRVQTIVVPVIGDLGEMYTNVDGGATAALVAKLAVEKSISSKLDDARNAVQHKCIQALKEYRSLINPSYRGSNRLLYPETLRLLAIYTLALTKSSALRGASDVPADERSVVGYDMVAMPIANLLQFLYPLFYSVHDIMQTNAGTVAENGLVVLPGVLPLSMERMDARGAYLLDNGRVLVLWLGKMLPQEFMRDAFGVDAHVSQVDVNQLSIESSKSELATRLRRLVESMRAGKPVYQTLYILRQGDPSEAFLFQFLIEDRTVGGTSFADFLSHIHRGVAQQGGK